MKALVIGSTGLVGSHLTDLLLADDDYSGVVTWVRRSTGKNHPKLIELEVDFDHPEVLEATLTIDHVYLCLGTTMAKAGSREEFFKVDHTYTIEGARWAQKKYARKACLISAIGASEKSWFYYSRVKGQVEKDLLNLNFNTTVIVRPSLLLGKRSEYRKGEVMAERISQWLPFLYNGPLNKYRPVHASDVARTMWTYTKESYEKIQLIESHQILPAK